ncbi:MAG: PQQ-binding-like beta-propeller repeat protein [Planctomycetes bacterium]|nr:PQQ-binding-like beta-propeller repeat protein [Planctomycetota bacterium]
MTTTESGLDALLREHLEPSDAAERRAESEDLSAVRAALRLAPAPARPRAGATPEAGRGWWWFAAAGVAAASALFVLLLQGSGASAPVQVHSIDPPAETRSVAGEEDWKARAEALIAQLADQEFAVREEAAEALRQLALTHGLPFERYLEARLRALPEGGAHAESRAQLGALLTRLRRLEPAWVRPCHLDFRHIPRSEGDRLLTSGYDGVSCLDTAAGLALWSFDGATAPQSPFVLNDRVYLVEGAGASYFTHLELPTGARALFGGKSWRLTINPETLVNPAWSSDHHGMAFDRTHRRIVFRSKAGELTAANLNGTRAWVWPVHGKEVWDSISPPVCRGDENLVCFSAVRNGKLFAVALYARDGAEAWRAELAAVAGSPTLQIAPLNHGERLIFPVGATEQGTSILACLEAWQGRPVWSRPANLRGPLMSALCAEDRVVLQTTLELSVFEASNGRPDWNVSKPNVSWMPPTVSAGKIYSVRQDGQLAVHALQDGKPLLQTTLLSDEVLKSLPTKADLAPGFEPVFFGWAQRQGDDLLVVLGRVFAKPQDAGGGMQYQAFPSGVCVRVSLPAVAR